MLHLLFGFLSVSSASQLLPTDLAKHLNVHQLIYVVETIHNPNILKSIEIPPENFILFQVNDPQSFRTNRPEYTKQTLVKIPGFLLIKPDIIDNFPGQPKWLVETNTTDLPYVPVDSDVWITNHQNVNQLETIHQLDRNSTKIVERYSQPYFQSPSVLRRNFQAIPLVISVPISNICNYKTGRWHYQAWLDFGKALNFTIVYANPEELLMKHGGKYDGQAVVVPFHAISLQRDDSMPNDTILAPIIKGWTYIYVKDALGTHGHRWSTYVRPFQTQVWFCLAGWLLLVSLINMTVHHIFRHKLRFIIETGLSPLDAICCQGTTIPDDRQQSRLTAFMPQLMAAIINPAYAAAIVSFLTFSIQTFPFMDIEGLIQDGTYRIGCLRIDFFLRTLLQRNEKLARLLVPKTELLDSYEKNLERLCRDEKYAFLAYNNLFIAAKGCKYLKIPTPVTFLFTGIPVALNSPYLPAFRWVLFNMHASGIISKAQKDTSGLGEFTKQQFNPIRLQQIVVPFLILLVGVIFAGFIIVCEFFRKPVRGRRKIEYHNRKIFRQLRKK